MSSTPFDPNGRDARTGSAADVNDGSDATSSDDIRDSASVAPGGAPYAGTDTGTDSDDAARGGRAGRAERVATVARRWRSELADLGGPNTLLWHEDTRDGNLELTTAHPGGVSMLMAGRATRLSDLVRERSAFEDARRRVQLIRAQAIELEQERGLRTCFMAIGMATWNVPGSPRRAQSPVLIRSCTLHPVNAAHTDYDIDLGDDLEVNPVLVNYLATRGIDVDPARLADLAYTSARFDPQPVFRELTRLCAGLSDLQVVDRKVVSTFSLAKLPMIADIAELGESLVGNDIIAALAGDPDTIRFLASDDVPDPEPDMPAVRELLVADADSSQEAAVDAVRAGLNIVVGGAPGTGRTQTIANIVGACVGTGKRVLVVSHKRAALTDLHHRLAECELGDIVLDFADGAHSPSVPSRAYAESVELAGPVAEPDVDDTARMLDRYRERLAAHREHLHEVREPWGVSVFDALSATSKLTQRANPPTSKVRLDRSTLARLDREACVEAGRTLREAVSNGAWSGGDDDPWAGARVLDSAAVDGIGALVRDLAGKRLASDSARLDEILGSVGVPPAQTPMHWAEGIDVLTSARRTLAVFTPAVYDADLDVLVDATSDRDDREARGVTLGWWARNSQHRKAKELLREGASERDMHAALVAARDELTRWRELGATGVPTVPSDLDEASRIWSGLSTDLSRLDEVLAGTRDGGGLAETPRSDLVARIKALDERRSGLPVLPKVVPLLDSLEAQGLRPLIDDLAERAVAADDAVDELELVWWSSLLDQVSPEGEKNASDDEPVEKALAEYMRLDRAFVRVGGRRVAARVAAGLRQARVMYADQANYLLAQDRARGHQVPPRELLGYTADALLAARPVWTMSPLVVASVIPPGVWFDVVVIDEANQVAAAEAVSAIARAAQVVLVGDEQGLPPSGFRLTAGPPDAADVVSTEQTESVFSALAKVLPLHRLTWQYGCEDERLFAFSNVHLYQGNTLTFPSAASGRPIELVSITQPERAPGDEAGPEADLLELEVAKVVELALDHARNKPEQSLGVVTVSPRNTHAILTKLRQELVDETDPVVLAFFEAQDEPETFFVKHLDRAAGDVRDAVIFSIGSSKGADGRALHRAGPLGLDGGERRLNSAITAARRHLTVVTSLTAADLDGGRMTSLGAQALHDLIAYAESGGDREVLRRQADAGRKSSNVTPLRASRRAEDDAILADFALHLRKEGLVVHERLGSSGQPLDLAVEDPYVPGRMVVAIESDGRRYAETVSTRERERLRAEQLTRMGWEYVRVWSEDVARKPAPDVARVIEAIRTADARGGRGHGRGVGARSRGAAPGRTNDLW